MKIGVALLDFGGPQGPDELEGFLRELLTDVLPGPKWLRAAAGGFLAPRRAKVVGPNYEEIGWSPLVPTHRAQAAALREKLGSDAPPIASGMQFTAPTMDECVEELLSQGVDRFVALPMYPHFSFATTGAAFNFFFDALKRRGLQKAPVHWVSAYPEHPAYIEALAATIREGVEGLDGPSDEPVHLVFTPHGLPVSFVKAGDPYPDHIRATVRAVIEELGWTDPYYVGWQSRVGPVQWLTPGTPEVMQRVKDAGGRRVCLVPISFAAEHIETLHEIDIEYREEAEEMGIEFFGRAPALGLQPRFVDALADLAREGVASFDRYTCVRCLIPKSEHHRRRSKCPNCQFTFPDWAREGWGAGE